MLISHYSNVNNAIWVIACTVISLCLIACESSIKQTSEDELPEQLKVAWDDLGRHLFYDRRLSMRNNRSCGICHEQAKGFTDGFVRAVGSTEDIHPRNTPTLINVSTRTSLGWIDHEPSHLEAQLLIPLLGEAPVEMGLNDLLAERLEELNNDPVYQNLLSDLSLSELTLEDLATAIAHFERTLTSYRSPYDQYLLGMTDALSHSAQRGLVLFSEVLACTQCHGGKDFDQPASSLVNTSDEGKQPRHAWFNTGLYDVNDGRYPEGREGLFEITGQRDDIGKYRVPTLRNLAFTGPYYHDGSGASLDDVLLNYNAGGRVTRSGLYAGDGRYHPNKHGLITELGLTSDELSDLKAFLLSLSDETIIDDPRFSDPWPRD